MSTPLPSLTEWEKFEWTFSEDFEDEDEEQEWDEGPGFWLEDISQLPLSS